MFFTFDERLQSPHPMGVQITLQNYGLSCYKLNTCFISFVFYFMYELIIAPVS